MKFVQIIEAGFFGVAALNEEGDVWINSGHGWAPLVKKLPVCQVCGEHPRFMNGWAQENKLCLDCHNKEVGT